MSYNRISDIVAGAFRDMGFGKKRLIPKRGLIKFRIAAFTARTVATALGRVTARNLIGKLNA